MTHLFPVDEQTMQAIQQHQKYLIIKENEDIAVDDKAILQHGKEQVEYYVSSVENGATSKRINGNYCLVGLSETKIAPVEIV